MPVYTTYLAYLKRFDYNPLKIFPNSLKSTLIYYVMRNRGNNEVAPDELILIMFKNNDLSWESYCRHYEDKLATEEAKAWMQKRAEESRQGHNVILVCYEKDPEQCHRRLLAEAIAARFGVEYKGELQ
jgi:uncharacterized protein YeaO (DUF488 family)